MASNIQRERQEFFKGLIQKMKNKSNLFDRISGDTKKPWIGAGIRIS